MALPMLVNGAADCGPSNALQGFTKQFEQDRGAVHDHFAQGSQSSRATFRTRPSEAALNPLKDDAARFFADASTTRIARPVPFDVSGLRGALPTIPISAPAVSHVESGWAADFARAMGTSSGAGTQAKWAMQTQTRDGAEKTQDNVVPYARSMPYAPMGMMNMPMQNWSRPISTQPAQQSEPHIVFPDVQYAQEAPKIQPEPAQSSSTLAAQENSELAETARQLLDALSNETRPKFKNSQFMGLMRQLRDGEVVVQDGDMVAASEARPVEVLDKGKAPAEGWATGVSNQPRRSVHFHSADPSTSHQAQAEGQVQNEDDAGFDNADVFYDIYNRTYHTAKLPDAQAAEWAQLQDDWDAFEATASGIRPVESRGYQFQKNNPYLNWTKTHGLHKHGAGLQQSVLEHEAAVQRDPSNAQAWLALGVKQQENERERHAIDALREAVALDPNCMPAHLALAISYANEGDKTSAHRSIGSWMVARGAKARRVAVPGELGTVENVATVDEIHDEYVRELLNLTRQGSIDEIDADVQTALGVLLNTVEDYAKAQDCFKTALAVRPDDWLLFNRVGATMANSGNPADAVPFYYKALELNPGYIRARYNLGISCINLRRHDEAAQHLVDALVLQDSEGISSDRGVTSDALWDTLRSTCLNLQRLDLAAACEQRDIQQFIDKFHQT